MITQSLGLLCFSGWTSPAELWTVQFNKITCDANHFQIIQVHFSNNGVSEDLKTFEQSQRGRPPFALSPGGLNGHHLGGGGRRQLLVARRGEGGDVEQRLVLADVDGRDQAGSSPALLGPPHRLVEDVLHRQEVQTGGHLEEETAETRRHGLSVALADLSESRNK